MGTIRKRRYKPMNNETRLHELTNTVTSHINEKEMSQLNALLADTNEVDILDMLPDLSAENQAVVYRLLSKDKALFVVERLDIA